MEPIEVIDNLNKQITSKGKEAILEQAWEDSCFDFFEGIQQALDPFTVLSVEKIPLIIEEDDEPDDLGIKQLLHLHGQLKKHQLTYKVAGQAIEDALNVSSVDAWNNWYRLILLQDFGKTVTPLQVNRVLTRFSKKNPKAIKYLIPAIKAQKHQLYQGDILIGNAYVDSFMFGVRTIIILEKDSNTVIAFNLRGKKVKVDERFDRILKILPISLMFDAVKVKNKLNIVDIMPLEEYRKGYTHRNQMQRHEALCELNDLFYETFKGDVSILPKLRVNLTSDKSFRQVIADFKAQGISTVMIKDLQAPYLTRKSKNWIKYPIE